MKIWQTNFEINSKNKPKITIEELLFSSSTSFLLCIYNKNDRIIYIQKFHTEKEALVLFNLLGKGECF